MDLSYHIPALRAMGVKGFSIKAPPPYWDRSDGILIKMCAGSGKLVPGGFVGLLRPSECWITEAI